MRPLWLGGSVNSETGQPAMEACSLCFSRAMTPTEERYAQIEEALGITQACERFREYLKVDCNGEINCKYYISLCLLSHAMHKKHIFNN